MITLRSAFLFSILAAFVSAAAVADDQDTVSDKNSKVVVNTFGNCVRTKWMSGNDACGAPKAEAPKPAPVAEEPKAPEISQDKRMVYFDFDKSNLRPDAVEKLDELVGLIKGNGQVKKFMVHAFTDKMGKNGYNNALSKKRAETVRKYLANRLHIPSNSDVRGLGVSHTADCNSLKNRIKRIECLGPDRRAEIELKYEK